jgi:hypothetical protein
MEIFSVLRQSGVLASPVAADQGFHKILSGQCTSGS